MDGIDGIGTSIAGAYNDAKEYASDAIDTASSIFNKVERLAYKTYHTLNFDVPVDALNGDIQKSNDENIWCP